MKIDVESFVTVVCAVCTIACESHDVLLPLRVDLWRGRHLHLIHPFFSISGQFILSVRLVSCLFDRFVMVFACLALSVFSTIEEFQESADVALLYMEGLVVFWFTVEFIFR
jgi:hypothetical protein